MTAGLYNFTMDQGSNWNLNVIYKDSAGVVINLTGYTAAMQLRQNYNSDTAELTLSTSNGGIVITGAQGKLVLAATAAQTAALDAGYYVYDLEITSGGVVTRILQGQITVAGEVTRV
jgi:hypothetical protein